MTHEGRLVIQEQLQGLLIRQMPMAIANAILKIERIFARVEHVFIIVGLQKSRITLFEMADDMFAR